MSTCPVLYVHERSTEEKIVDAFCKLKSIKSQFRDGRMFAKKRNFKWGGGT